MADNEEKLVKMLKYVSEHNEFYKNRIREYGITNPLDITQWPTLTSNEAKRIAPTNSIADVPEKVLYSSGSTGLAKKVTWANRDYVSMCLNAWKLRDKWYHISPNMKTLHFYGSALNNDIVDFQQINSDYYRSNNELFINYRCLYNKSSLARDVINDFLPEVVFAFPSMFFALLENSGAEKWQNNVRYIELFGEGVTSSHISEIKKNVPNAQCSVMYGTTETGVIALTCPHAHMHIVEQNCFVESIDGHLVLTSLKNTQTPYVRYFINDVGTINYLSCSCGLNSFTIVDLKGRDAADIVTSNYNTISAIIIPECINMVNAEFGFSIVSYYAEQLIPGELNVYIALSKLIIVWQDTIIERLKMYLSRMADGLKAINVFTDIPITLKKRNYYVCRCCKNEKR